MSQARSGAVVARSILFAAGPNLSRWARSFRGGAWSVGVAPDSFAAGPGLSRPDPVPSLLRPELPRLSQVFPRLNPMFADSTW